MSLRFTPDALAEIEDILGTIEAEPPTGATRVGERIFETADVLAGNPGMGVRTRRPRPRRIVVRPFPYLMFYEVDGPDVTVIAVRHGARDPRTVPDAP